MSYVPRKIAKVAKMLPIQLPNRGLRSDGIPAIKTSLGLGKLWLVWRVGFWDAKWGRGSSQRVHLRHGQGFFRWNFAHIPHTLFVIEQKSGYSWKISHLSPSLMPFKYREFPIAMFAYLRALSALVRTWNIGTHVCDGQNSIHVVRSWHRFIRPPIATHSPSTLFIN